MKARLRHPRISKQFTRKPSPQVLKLVQYKRKYKKTIFRNFISGYSLEIINFLQYNYYFLLFIFYKSASHQKIKQKKCRLRYYLHIYLQYTVYIVFFAWQYMSRSLLGTFNCLKPTATSTHTK